MTTLIEHAKLGVTSICNAWAITRTDGVTFGFTDHDMPLSFEQIDFRPESGMSAAALAQTTGLSVDNTEAMGALSHSAIREDDIEAGRFDAAEVRAWRVNWADVSVRKLVFRGTIGEIRRVAGAFHAELRGLTEMLNRPQGRIYQKPCTAVLGDAQCRFDTAQSDFRVDLPLETHVSARQFTLSGAAQFDREWFRRGRLDVLSGAGAGLWGVIKDDQPDGDQRVITLWEPIRAQLQPGDMLRLTAGCDKRAETCRHKFQNLVNFQGFPDLPGEDWVLAYPKNSGNHTGGSLR